MLTTRLIRRIVIGAALPIAILLAWWWASRGSESFYFPPLDAILSTFADVWFSSRAREDVLPSLLRLAAGYGLAAILGVAIGIPVGASAVLRRLLEPGLEFFRAIPPPVLVPVLTLFAGVGDAMKVTVIAAGAVWPILLNTVEGVRGRDEIMRDVARSYRLGPVRTLVRFTVPAASPQIFAGLRQSLSIAVILMVVSEMFAASNGIGFSIVQFQRGFAVPEMWSGILLLGLLGFALSALFGVAERAALGWYHGWKAVEHAR